MIDSGLPLVQCLDIQAKQAENPTFREELGVVKEAVESGSTFADALKKFPNTFDELFQNMIAAGEVGGILDTILTRLATYLEKAEKLKRQIKGALMYPTITMLVAGVVVSILLLFVVPQLSRCLQTWEAIARIDTIGHRSFQLASKQCFGIVWWTRYCII